MKKNKKLLLALGSIASVAAPIAAVVSCGSGVGSIPGATTPGVEEDANPGYGDGSPNDAGNIWKAGSHRNVVTSTPTKDGNNPWANKNTELLAPLSSLKSTILGEAKNATQIGLFRKEKLGYDDFKKVTIQTPHGPETKIISSPNRETVLKFELADKVIFQYKSGQAPATKSEKDGNLVDIQTNLQVVFDSDSADPLDTKSINGKHFEEVLKSGKFVRMQFHVSDEARKHNWIKQLTGEKGASFSANDIWAGMQYEFAESGVSRYANGGNSSLDDWTNKNSGISSDLFVAPEPSQPQSYYLGSELSLGIFADQFKTENKGNVVADESTFNLNFNGKGDGNQLKTFWNEMFKSEGGIKAMSASEVADAISTVDIPLSAFKDAAAKTAFEKTDVYKSGAYQLNYKDFKNHYVGGTYYVSQNDPKKFTIKLNEDYVKQSYINEKNSKGERTHIDTYSTEFVVDSDLVQTTMAAGFKQGTTVSADIKGFSDSELINAINHQAQSGLHFSAGYTSGSTLGDYTTDQLVPFLSSAKVLGKDGIPTANPRVGQVFYNNNYAKVVWGKTISQLKTDDKYTGAFESLFDGTGFEFRTAIQSAINAFTAQKEANDGTQEWTSWFAPEGGIPNHEGGDEFYPAHADSADTKDADILAALKSLTSKFTESVGTNGAITSIEHTRESYEDIYTSDTDKASEKYSAKDVDSIKKVMKDALDKAGIKEGQKVSWEFSWGRGMTNTNDNPIYEELRKAINSLDPRLNLVAKMNPGTENGSKEASVAVEAITPDFSMDDKSDSSKHFWISRLFAAKIGANSGSLNVGNPYSISSPASPILANVGYLQTGVFGGLSYFAANPDKMTKANHLDGLKPVIKSLTDTLADAKTKWDDVFDALPQTETGAAAALTTIKTALQSLDIKNICDSSVTDIANYDWFGWKDLKAIGKLKETAAGLNPNSQVAAAISTANDLINNWLRSAMYNLQSWMEAGTTSSLDVIDTMIAYNIIAPWSINPLDATLGNRENPGQIFKKNWYTSGGDAEGVSSVDYFRVDLD